MNEEKNVDKYRLFENLEKVWRFKGEQPVFRDMSEHPSEFTADTYKSRFGSWNHALKEFVDYINDDDIEETSTSGLNVENQTEDIVKRRTSRNTSNKIRFRILLKNGFTCQSCGASLLKSLGVELHVDHIIPWSKGGETEDANLEPKRAKCNLGKGNAFDK